MRITVSATAFLLTLYAPLFLAIAKRQLHQRYRTPLRATAASSSANSLTVIRRLYWPALEPK